MVKNDVEQHDVGNAETNLSAKTKKGVKDDLHYYSLQNAIKSNNSKSYYAKIQ